MKYVVIPMQTAIEEGYLDPDEKWEGEELMIGEDGYAYIDNDANDPVKGDWDFADAAKQFPKNIEEV